MALSDGQKIKRICTVLKRHFTNLTVGETIDLAVEVVEALREEGPSQGQEQSRPPTAKGEAI